RKEVKPAHSELGYAACFGNGLIHAMAGNRSQTDKSLAIVVAEVGKPIVINTVELNLRLVVGHYAARHMKTVQHFRLYAITVLILQTQLRRGWAEYAFASVREQAGRSDAVDTITTARDVLHSTAADRSSAAYSISEPEVQSRFGDPHRAVSAL